MSDSEPDWRLTKARVEFRKSRVRLSEARTRQEIARARQEVDLWSRRVADLERKE